MPTPKKEKTVQEIREKLAKSSIAILTGYRGLKTADLAQLRRKLRESNSEYHVVKNTLAELAAKGTDKEGISQIFKGPTAVAFGYGDEVELARILQDHIRSTRLDLPIAGAVLKGRVLRTEEVATLATLPAREVLIARVLGGLQQPIAGLVTVLNGNMRGLVNVLQARARQLEGAQ